MKSKKTFRDIAVRFTGEILSDCFKTFIHFFMKLLNSASDVARSSS